MLKNTCIDYKFEDGDNCKLTLAFYQLYMLKGKNKLVYDEYNRIMTKGVSEELDMIHVLYTAYLCANIENIDTCMNKTEFMVKCGSDRLSIKEAMELLVKPKKQ